MSSNSLILIKNLLIVFLLLSKLQPDTRFLVSTWTWSYVAWSCLHQNNLNKYSYEICKIKNRGLVKKHKIRSRTVPSIVKLNRKKFLALFFSYFNRLSRFKKEPIFSRFKSYLFIRNRGINQRSFNSRFWFNYRQRVRQWTRKKWRFDKRRRKYVYFKFKSLTSEIRRWRRYIRFCFSRRKRFFKSLKFYRRRRRGSGLSVRRRRRRRRKIKWKWLPKIAPVLYNKRFEFFIRSTDNSLRLRFENYLLRLDKIVFEYFPLARRKPTPVIIQNLVESTDDVLLELKNLTLNIFIKKKRSSYIITLTNGAGEVKFFYSSDRIWAAVKEVALTRGNSYLLPENRTTAVVLALFYKTLVFLKKNYKKNRKIDTIFTNRLFNTYVIKQLKLMFRRRKLLIKKFVYLRKIPHGRPTKKKKKRRI